MPHVQLAVVEDSGHLSPLEQPTVVGAHLRAWLTDDVVTSTVR